MIITIDTCDNGCVVSYTPNSTTPMPMMGNTTKRIICTDEEAQQKVGEIIAEQRAK